MLYLVSEKGQRTIKIGYTSRPTGRQDDYACHSTVTQFLDWREGTKKDEKIWHEYFEFVGFEKVFPDREKSEWYYLPNYINKAKMMKADSAMDYILNEVEAYWKKRISEL